MKIISAKNYLPSKNLFASLLALFFIAISFSSCHTSISISDSGWEQLSPVLERIIPPVFPEEDFIITDYGALGDGKMDCTEAFQKTIQACTVAGGGRVIVPAGIYLTGAIHLKSNVNLHLVAGATILFSEDETKYLPVVYTRFEGVECFNYSPLIYAFQQENIAITGGGTLDGQAGIDNWWAWKGNIQYGWEDGEPNGDNAIASLYQMSEDNIPVTQRIFGKGYYLRPNFIQIYQCRNVLIDSVTIKRSPMWVIHPVLCENVTVQNVKVISHGPNNDGCNPESSRNIWIKNCYFDTGDDCIAIKSGRNSDGRRINVPSEYIIIQRCIMKDGHGGVVIGSEMSGSVRNIFVEDCLMDSPYLDRAIRVKTNSLRGGIVEKIYVRNLTIGEVREAVISVNFNYGEGDVGEFTPIVRDIYLDHIVSRKSKYAILLNGYERSPISNLMLENCTFNGVNDGNLLNHYVNLTLKNVYINGELQ